MKKTLSILLFLLFCIGLYAQKGLVNNASNLKIGGGSFVKLEGSKAHYVNKNNGKIDLDGRLQIEGDWDNQGSSVEVFRPLSTGRVEFKGSTPQTIWGSTHFQNLHILNTSGVITDNTLEVDDIFVSNDGIIEGAGQDIKIYGNWNSSTGFLDPQNSHLYFIGDNNQDISSTTTQNFSNVTLNNEHTLNINNDLSITNLYMTSGAIQTSANAEIETKLVYNGDAAQVSGSEWPEVTTMDVFIENTSPEGVTLSGNKSIDLGKTITVSGHLQMEHDTLSGLGVFTLLPGATLSSRHLKGLDGNLQMDGIASLSTEALYTFNGIISQETGEQLPDEVSELSINITEGSATLSRPGLTTITNILDINHGYLIVKPDGQLTVEGNTLLNDTLGLVLQSDLTGTASFIDNGNISGGGKAYISRFLEATTSYGWYLTPPIIDAHSSMFDDPASGIWFYKSLLPGWQQVTNSALNTMTGYVTKYPDDHTVTFKGLPNTGLMQRADLVRTFTPNNFGWNLIGNPYPSAFDWDSVQMTQMNSAMYIRLNNGTVATYVNGLGVPYGTTSHIPAMQAFWVQVNSSFANGSVTFNNNGRVHDVMPFYKEPLDFSMIRLEADNGHYKDEVAVYFSDEATDIFNSTLEAYNIYNDIALQPDIFTYNEANEKLTVDAVMFAEEHLAVPVGYTSISENISAIRAYDFSEIDDGVSIHLEDLKLQVMHNLRQNNTYFFNSTPNDMEKRFVLHFNYMPLDNGELTLKGNEDMNVFANASNIYIQFPTQTGDTYTIKVYNLPGQLVYSETLSNPESLHKINLNTAKGYFIVQVLSQNVNFVQKVSLF